MAAGTVIPARRVDGNSLISNADCDPLSRIPGLDGAEVRLAPTNAGLAVEISQLG